MKYNERIREIREDNNLTQQKVANLPNVGQRTFADYESGKTRNIIALFSNFTCKKRLLVL